MQQLDVQLPRVEDAVERLHTLLQDQPRIALRGRIGAGRSTLLRALSQSPVDGKRFVLIAPPEGDDAAAIGLSQLAAQLDPSGKLLATMREPSNPWRAKLDAALDTMRAQAAGTVVLIDHHLPSEPSFITSVFTRRARELVDELIASATARVVAGNAAVGSEDFVVTVSTHDDPATLLAPERWGMLADAATALSQHAGSFVDFSPLDLRLRVLLVSVGMPAREAATLRIAPHDAVRRWLDRLRNSARVRTTLGRLALVRTGFDASLLERIGFDALPADQQIALRAGLIFGDDDDLRLHETIAHSARASEWLDEPTAAHRLLADWHHLRFQRHNADRHVNDATRHEMEEIHHLTEARDARTLLERSLWFVEQYDALGRALSLGKKYDDAITAYGRAIAFDDTDDYAHHYRAWNLDVLGREASYVEAGYRRARELRPEHAWYQGRFISFLATRGRIREARAGWDAALAELFGGGPAVTPDVYRELHGEVARLLLHRGRLDFAEQVLEDVPHRFRREPWCDALTRLLTMLREAERDEVVFPPSIPLDERWSGPHLVSDEERLRVRSWMAGRVSAVDSEVHLRMGGPDGLEWRDVELTEYRALAGQHETPRAGTYIEWLTYLDGQQRILTYRLTGFQDGALPKLFPNPDRYLRNAS